MCDLIQCVDWDRFSFFLEGITKVSQELHTVESGLVSSVGSAMGFRPSGWGFKSEVLVGLSFCRSGFCTVSSHWAWRRLFSFNTVSFPHGYMTAAAYVLAEGTFSCSFSIVPQEGFRCIQQSDFCATLRLCRGCGLMPCCYFYPIHDFMNSGVIHTLELGCTVLWRCSIVLLWLTTMVFLRSPTYHCVESFL